MKEIYVLSCVGFEFIKVSELCTDSEQIKDDFEANKVPDHLKPNSNYL